MDKKDLGKQCIKSYREPIGLAGFIGGLFYFVVLIVIISYLIGVF